MNKDEKELTFAKGGTFNTLVPNATLFEKEINGQKRLFMRGIATDTLPDLVDDYVGLPFIKSIVEDIKGKTVFFEHQHTLDKTLGVVSESVMNDIDDKNKEVVVEAALQSPDNNEYVKQIKEKYEDGIPIGFSIGGVVRKARKKFDETLKRNVVELTEGTITELSVTAYPANPRSFGTLLTKSLHDSIDSEGSEMQIEEMTIEKTAEDSTESIVKMLEEIVEVDALHESLYNFFWALHTAIRRVTYDENMSPEQKKTKIMEIADEYSNKVTEIMTRLAEIEAEMQSQVED